MLETKILARLRVKEWVEERDIEILAKGLNDQETDTTYEKVMRRLEGGVGGGVALDKRAKETRRVHILLIAGRNRGCCEFEGCNNSIWTYTQMHWHHHTHTHTQTNRWISGTNGVHSSSICMYT